MLRLGNPSTSEIVVITVTVVAVLLAIGGIVMLTRRYTKRSLQGAARGNKRTLMSIHL